MTEIFDITIIGGGPSGLFTAFYAGMRQAKTKIIDSLASLGGQPRLLYPEKKIYDIPAFPSITGQELSGRLIQQVKSFNPTICLQEEVLSYDKNEESHFTIQTNKGQHQTKALIIAAGAGAFQPRKLDLEGAESYEGRGLEYLVGPLESYQGLDVVINGGGDSAVDWAMTLEKVAKQVSLCHRRNSFRAMDYSVDQLKASSVKIYTPFEPYELHGDGEKLTAVTFKERRKEATIKLKADVFIVSYGFHTSLGSIDNWPLEKNRDGIIVNEKMETQEAGIYAVGDIATHPGKIDLIATAFGEAPIAVNHAMHYINPELAVQPIQSTKLTLDD